MSPVQFRESDHTYWLGPRRLPSVTEVLKPLYGELGFVKDDVLQYKSELGTAVHKAVELHVNDGLIYDSLEGPVADYFEQFLVFEAETGFKTKDSELLVHSAAGYAGTLDLMGELNGYDFLLDLKCTAALSPVVKLQTAAYQAAYNEQGRGPVSKRGALRLYPGGYRLETYRPDPADYAAFLGLLKVGQWCAANKTQLGEIK